MVGEVVEEKLEGKVRVDVQWASHPRLITEVYVCPLTFCLNQDSTFTRQECRGAGRLLTKWCAKEQVFLKERLIKILGN